MLELTRQEALRLKLTLEWVLTATLGNREDREAIESAKDKISNIIKADPGKERIPIFLEAENETN